MKRLILLTLLLLELSCYAQDHLKFMGIPLAGELNDFVEKLQKHNSDLVPYEIDENNDETYKFKGNFYKFKNCYITIDTFGRFKQVTKGSVELYKCYKYEEELLDLVSDLIDKYGKPQITEDNSSFLKQRWILDLGMIEVTLLKMDGGTLNIQYIDYLEATGILESEEDLRRQEVRKEQDARDDL